MRARRTRLATSRARMDEGSPGTSKIALTGATGFIGFELQCRLVADGFSVRAIVRPRSRNRNRIAAGVEVTEVALNDGAGLAAAVDGVDAVVYAAGTVRGRDRIDFQAANVDGLRVICEALPKRAKRPHVLLISSLAATRPELSHYAHSKCEGEQILRACEQVGWTILRPPTVYGPGDKEMRPVFRSIRSGLALIVGPAQQRLSFLHVEDLAHAVAASLRYRNECLSQVFEIDDGYAGGYDWSEIIACCKGRLPVVRMFLPKSVLSGLSYINLLIAYCLRIAPMLTPGKARELSQKTWLCDNAPFTSITGWAPEVQLGEGVQRLFAAPG